MKISFVLIMCSAMVGAIAISSPVIAQQKTVKACQEEWRANRAANEKAGITQKAYVEKCRAESAAAKPAETKPAAKPAATPKPVATPQKTVRACQEEWRANRAANEKAGITQKAYVEKCRAGMATARPAPASAPISERPAARTTAPTITPPVSTTTPPAPKRAPTAAGTPASAGQFATEAEAKVRCPRDTIVWVNLDSKIYHFAGYKDYGNTKTGAYMCERDTAARGFRAAKNEKHP
jgi:hypothetical protein